MAVGKLIREAIGELRKSGQERECHRPVQYPPERRQGVENGDRRRTTR